MTSVTAIDQCRRAAIFVLMSLAAIGGAIVANAPDTLPFLWELKAATASFTAIAGLLLHLTDPPSTK